MEYTILYARGTSFAMQNTCKYVYTLYIISSHLFIMIFIYIHVLYINITYLCKLLTLHLFILQKIEKGVKLTIYAVGLMLYSVLTV